MNRIYQGRVSTVELLKEKPQKEGDPLIRECSKKEGGQLLWDFHELFQDAVNYYLVCLMALASDPENPIMKIRRKVDGEGPENVWKSFRRNGQKRQGLCEVAKYFGLDPQRASLDECCEIALKGNESSREVLDLALQELLHYCGGEGKIQQEGRSMLPRFCNPKYLGNFNAGKTANLRAYGERRLSTEFHKLNTDAELIAFSKEMEMGWVVNESKRGKVAKGEAARTRLLKSVAHFGQVYGTHKSNTDMGNRVLSFLESNVLYKEHLVQIEKQILAMDESQLPAIAPNARSIPDRLEACILFKYFPTAETANLVRVSFPVKEDKNSNVTFSLYEQFGDDAIKLSRGKRGYAFSAFTALNSFGGNGSSPEWIDFDIAAFKEALKAFHQVELKGAERRKEKDRKQKILDFMLTGKGSLKMQQAEDESFEIPPVLKNDPRISQVEKVVKSLAFVSDLKGGELSEYGLRERSIRGYEKLAKEWNKLELDGLLHADAKARLKGKLTELQVDRKETVGSVVLFEKLIDPEHWIIWNEPTEEIPAEWASNPLDAYVQKLKLEEEISHLSESIRFTPADARYSRRQYQLGDKNTFKSMKGACHHEQNSMAVVVGIAVKKTGVWEKQRVRINYSAPRFLREGLRGDTEDLIRMPWLQPMMEAFGADLKCLQDLHNFPVFLMPKKGRSDENIINLNFPVTLDESAVCAAVGKRERWIGQFAGGKDSNIYLRWPDDKWPKGWKEKAWYNNFEPFSLVSVDLGVRDAGALALLECRPNDDFGITPKGKKRHCRYIGEANGEKWYAAVRKTKMLRLPGEDAMVWRDGKLQQELSGEKGRLAKVSEMDEAQEIVTLLGYDDFIGNDSRSFAEQNRKLLLTLRWAQGRLRSWQSLSWKLGVDAEKESARQALQDDEKLSADLKRLVEEEKWMLVPEQFERDITVLKNVLSNCLERIANRVVPLRGRNWKWTLRDDEVGYILRQTERGSDLTKTRIAGQRGLSIERIELIEELRHRCQSLNKALQHVPGTKPKLGFGTKGMAAADPCPDILDKLDQLREQRVNQTAHLILAETLGVQLKSHGKTKSERIAKDVHGEYEKVRDPVDFIVLEDLNRYLTSQGRSRSENSRLMKWCHRAILGKLKQLCETYGIAVVETAAAYSSRFSAKDGAPGFRAKEVILADRENYPWKKMLGQKEKDAVALFRQLEEVSRDQNPKKPRKLLAPVAGGPIFIPMAGGCTQADINAAINLGLRAVAAPDVLEIHHKIRTENKNGTLIPLTRSNREKARWGKNPDLFEFATEVKHDRNPNCFPLVNFQADYENCTLDRQLFATGKGLWGTIKNKQWQRVAELNKERIRRNGWSDEIPM